MERYRLQIQNFSIETVNETILKYPAAAKYIWVRALTSIGVILVNADASGVSGSVGISSIFGFRRLSERHHRQPRQIRPTRTLKATTISQKRFCIYNNPLSLY